MIPAPVARPKNCLRKHLFLPSSTTPNPIHDHPHFEPSRSSRAIPTAAELPVCHILARALSCENWRWTIQEGRSCGLRQRSFSSCCSCTPRTTRSPSGHGNDADTARHEPNYPHAPRPRRLSQHTGPWDTTLQRYHQRGLHDQLRNQAVLRDHGRILGGFHWRGRSPEQRQCWGHRQHQLWGTASARRASTRCQGCSIHQPNPPAR